MGCAVGAPRGLAESAPLAAARHAAEARASAKRSRAFRSGRMAKSLTLAPRRSRSLTGAAGAAEAVAAGGGGGGAALAARAI